MNALEVKRIYSQNQDALWKQAYRIALIRFLDAGNDVATAECLADDLMFEINWTLANPE